MTLGEPGVGSIHLWPLEAWWRDVRLTGRAPRNQRGFSAVALLTLAGCIGPNLAIFAVVNAILLRPLPFPEPQRLVAMYNEYPHSDLARSHSSFANLYYRRGSLPAFVSLAAYKADAVNVGDATSSQRADILRVSADFFETLGALPGTIGRQFPMLGFRWFLAGAVPGLAIAWFASHAMRSLRLGIPPFHLPTLTAIALVLGLVSLAAGLVPAWRASRVDPCEALRQE